MDDVESRCLDAKAQARKKTLKTLEQKGPSIEKLLLRLKQSLDAKHQRVFYDRSTGNVIYSKKMIDHGSRLKAIELAAELWDIKPSQKHEVEHDLKQNTMAMVARVINQGQDDGAGADGD